MLNHLRLLLLVLGPLPILVCSWSVSRWIKPSNTTVTASNTLVFDLVPGPNGQPGYVGEFAEASISDAALEEACRVRGEQVAAQLDDVCQHIVRSPFIIAGDLPTSKLEQWYERTIHPASVALWENYFKKHPDEPIVVLLFNSAESYNHFASSLFNDEGVSIFGYYKPRQRTLVMNISTGGGTLLHELTHALADFDFPTIPDWFNEGLASLHEQARLTDDPPRIEGLLNWRLPVLREAIERERLGSLETLIARDDFRGTDEGVNYAQARYFCFFMQQQGVLRDFYREFRESYADDPTGAKAVRKAFDGQSWQQLEDAFRSWIDTLEDPSRTG